MGMNGEMTANIYSIMDYFYLALIILSTILLLVALISVISAFAKTVKEATSAVIPLMIVIMFVCAIALYTDSAQKDWFYYTIPIYNSVQSMISVFSLAYSPINIILTALSNLVFACGGGIALTMMFNSEKVMFSR